MLVSRHTPLILPALQQPLGNLVLLNDVDVRSPTGESVSVDGVEKSLGDRLEEVIRLEIGLPKTFASTEKLVGGSSSNDEVLRKVDAADAIEAVCLMLACGSTTLHLVLYVPANERLPISGVDARHDRAHKPRTEPPLV